MTAKRFRISKVFELNKPFPIYDGDCPLTQKEASDLLNEQHETIQRLNENITELLSVNVEEELLEENEQLKKENQRMTDKLNQLALEFLNYDMVTMGKATEISEMCYYDFLKYRKENGNPMELQL